MAKDTKVMNHCTEQSIWKAEKSTLTNCTAVTDTQALFDEVYSECHLKSRCIVHI